jgi:hypothetical protein
MGQALRRTKPIDVLEGQVAASAAAAGQVDPPPVIIWRTVDELIPYARNARLHTPKQIDQIAASIREFGFTNPVLIGDDNGIIAGHGRVLAARRLELARVPCLALSHLTPAQRQAYIIADNKLALNARWDDELLAGAFDDLVAIEFDIDVLGFSDSEMYHLRFGLGDGGDAEIDNVQSSWAVVVECADEEEQVALIAELQAKGHKVKGSIT